MMKGVGKVPVRQAISRPIPKGPEHNPWFWNPRNLSASFAPDSFRKRLKSIDPSLEITWNPIGHRWLVWAQAPKFNSPVCQGWRLLFVHHGAEHQYLPLDERVFARIYQIDSTRNGGKAYFDRILAEFERDEAKKKIDLRQDAIDRAMPYWEHSQIKNIGKGSKFATYHA